MRFSFSWLTGLLRLPVVSVKPSVLHTIHAINIRRFYRLSILMTVVHILHVIAFLMKDVNNADRKVILWRYGIIYSHLLLAIITLSFAVLCRPGRQQSEKEAATCSIFAVALYLTFGAVVVMIDQLVTPAVTPFLVASIGIGATVLLPPLRSFPLYVAAILLVSIGAGYTQESAEKLLSLRVNAITIGLSGAGLNWVLFSGKEQRDRIFDKEEPISTAGTEGERGRGLGLLLSKQFVERGGGQIDVESNRTQGSRFYFTLK